MKAPEPENEPARLEALRQFEILDSPREEAFDDLTKLTAYVCAAPIALVTLVDENRQWFKSRIGITLDETPRDISFCAHAILQPGTFIIPDARADERFASSPLVTGEPHVRFYAGVPLISAEGYRLGTLCVIDHVPRELNGQQIEMLEALSRQVMSQLELRHTVSFLTKALNKHRQ